MNSKLPDIRRGDAVFSIDRLYRYELWRELKTVNHDKSTVAFIGLNPSTADEVKNDPTVTRCVGYAMRWGYARMCMLNLFAYRSTDPKKLRQVDNPIGELNDYHLKKVTGAADLIVACWGTHGKLLQRGHAVEGMIDAMWCFGFNADGSPKHPLYLRRDASIFSFT